MIQTLLRFLRSMSMVVWVGGLAFFAFVLAPIAFHRLGSAHEAGVVVGGTLRVLHGMGLVAGVMFCGATAAMGRRRFSRAEVLLVIAMLCGTAYSQFHILPKMEADRIAAGGDVQVAPFESDARKDFERLHRLSERIEGVVFFCGVGVILLMAAGSQPLEQ